MIDLITSNQILSLIKKNSLVIDVGGGKFPFKGSTHIMDFSVPDSKLFEQVPNLKKENYFVRDILECPWPFEDKYFDFSVCSHTLEDLRDPIAVCKELIRVSKAGYISCPTRAQESNNKILNRDKIENNLIGYSHHRWFVEIRNSVLTFIHKNDFLYNNKKLIINEVGQKNLNFFWYDSFAFTEKLIKKQDIIMNYYNYKKEHLEWFNQSRRNYDPSRYNYVDNKFQKSLFKFNHTFEIQNKFMNNLKSLTKVYLK